MQVLEELWKMLENIEILNLSQQKEEEIILLSEPNYHTTKFFTENLLAIQIKKTQVLMNKPVYLRLSILELSKILMYEFWYDYVKVKYDEKAKLCYMDADSFTVYIKSK